jgi:AcrR family transcriptional regulator
VKSKKDNPITKQYNKTEKIQLIKKNTRQMIESKGYDATTNHGIAAQAEISVGLLYKYFPRGKIDIIHALMQDEQIALSQYYKEKPLDILSNKNYKELIKQMLIDLYQNHILNKKYIQALEIAMLSHPEIFRDVRGTAQEILTLEKLLQKLWDLDLIDQNWSHDEIILRTMLLDQFLHQYLFYRILQFSNDETFLNYLYDLFCQIFKIKY